MRSFRTTSNPLPYWIMSQERTNKRVLVVDDDAAVREAIKAVLERAGYQVKLAMDGREAVARFWGERFDLLILDLNLPFLSGWDVFERATTRYPLVPVIIITGLPDQYQTALAAGVATLMEKPVDALALLTTIEEVLSEPMDKRLLRLGGHLSDTRHIRPVSQSRFDGRREPNEQQRQRPLHSSVRRRES
jgi:CheY-like chemotaxis protein